MFDKDFRDYSSSPSAPSFRTPIILGIVLTGALVAAYFLFFSPKSLNEENLDIYYFAKKAIEKENPDICMEHPRDYGVWMCYRIVAVRTLDPSVCEKINNAQSQKCIFDIFIYDKNSGQDTCKMISDISTRSHCLRLLAIRSKDSKICEEVEDDTERNFCFTNLREGVFLLGNSKLTKQVEVECSKIIPNCKGDWLSKNPDIDGRIKSYCSDICLASSRRYDSYTYVTKTSLITCRCS